MNRYIFLIKARILGNKRNLIIFLVLIVGLITTVVFLQRQQIFRSGAYVNNDAFEVKNDRDEQLSCQNGICQTDTLRVKIKLVDQDKLEK